MSVLNVAFYGSDEMASNIAKKGDSRDVVSYVFKETKDEKVRILSLLRPLKHPESCLLYTSPSPRDRQKSRMPSSA